MFSKQEMQLIVSLKRALQRELGIEIGMQPEGLAQRLLKLASLSEDGDVRELAAQLRVIQAGEAKVVYRGRSVAPATAKTEEGDRQIKGYYRGNPIYSD